MGATAVPRPDAVMARVQGENFPVASRLLPAEVRRDLLAIYGFARLVDDAGDEAAGDRAALLDHLEREVDLLFAGAPTHPLFRRLVPTVRRHRIPDQPFRRLIAANRQDQTVRRYPTFSDLRAYCELSANPVGHLVLHVLEAATPERVALSDDVCTGLQLVEHWQDVREDHGRGRIYVPQDDLVRFGVPEAILGSDVPTEAFHALMAFEEGRARSLLASGAPLAATFRGRARYAVAAFAAGGLAALDAMARADHDVLSGSPRPGALRRARWLLAVLRGGAG
ncbi:MAG TPA: squalene synthase HpnC [Actinomycetota bacterium]|nr:squalene synthase HpnC [Actinomycetota bacterium]